MVENRLGVARGKYSYGIDMVLDGRYRANVFGNRGRDYLFELVTCGYDMFFP
jgi:hypothetical protein